MVGAEPFERIVGGAVVGHEEVGLFADGVRRRVGDEAFKQLAAVPVEYYYREFLLHIRVSSSYNGACQHFGIVGVEGFEAHLRDGVGQVGRGRGADPQVVVGEALQGAGGVAVFP